MHYDDIPTGLVPQSPLGASHRRLDRDAWDDIRRAYLAGEPGAALAARYGVSLSIVRTRARQEGWRRADADPDMDAPATLTELANDPRPDPGMSAVTALKRAVRAVDDGRAAEAVLWTRIAQRLQAVARRETPRD